MIKYLLFILLDILVLNANSQLQADEAQECTPLERQKIKNALNQGDTREGMQYFTALRKMFSDMPPCHLEMAPHSVTSQSVETTFVIGDYSLRIENNMEESSIFLYISKNP